MPNKNYLAGRRFEYEAVKQLEEQGYTCLRASGSHGPYDIMAWKTRSILAIQCKVVSNSTDGERLLKRWHAFPPFQPALAPFTQQLWIKVKGTRQPIITSV